MRPIFIIAIFIATMPLCAQSNSEPETYFSQDSFKLNFQVYVQSGYGFSSSEGAPIHLLSHFDQQQVAPLQNLQDAPAGWTVKPPINFGFSMVNYRRFNLFLGLETDLSFLSFAAEQHYNYPLVQQGLKFSGNEWRWNLKFFQGYKLNRFIFRVDCGISCGFAKQFMATLTETYQTTNTYVANQAPFRNADFSFTFGAGAGIFLTKKWQLLAIWENNIITTGKYEFNSQWFGTTTKSYQFIASQILLRVSYQFSQHLRKGSTK